MVVTIIVLLILATVSINLVINNGILDKAKTAVDKYSEGEIEEQIKLSYQEYQMEKLSGGTNKTLSDYIQEKLRIILNDNVLTVLENAGIVTLTFSNGNTYRYKLNEQYILKSTEKKDSYVGYYADIDSDGTVDGVIFADLLTGSVRETQKWTDNRGTYTLPTNVKIDNVNEYYISKSSYTWAGITKPVISPKTTDREKRFYILQLSNFTTSAKTDGDETENYPAYTNYCFYANAEGHMSPLITSNNFGEGKENTRKMIEKWNAAAEDNPTVEPYIDSAQDKQDIWKHIQTQYDEGWFLPSRAEWAAFANEIGGDNPITTSNYYDTYGLSDMYWSSSQDDTRDAWIAYFKSGCMFDNYVRGGYKYSVRLATIF